jgi:hypothetical protein
MSITPTQMGIQILKLSGAVKLRLTHKKGIATEAMASREINGN